MNTRFSLLTCLGVTLAAHGVAMAQTADDAKEGPADAAKAPDSGWTEGSAPADKSAPSTDGAASPSAPAEAAPSAPQASAPEASAPAAPTAPASSPSEKPTEQPAASEEAADSSEAAPSGTPLTLKSDSVPELRGPKGQSAISLSPDAPQSVALPGGITPAFGEKSVSSSDWLFDIHGFLMLPLRVGLNEREHAYVGQKKTVLHTPPVVPGNFETFDYTGVVPDPWVQLNFSYGNRDVTATVIIAARSVTNGTQYFNPPDQLGINDAFISFHPKTDGQARYVVNVGAFASRYGAMGEYDLGRYGTPLIARVSGMGVTGTTEFPVNDTWKATLEAGAVGQINKAPVGVEPAGWNGFTDPNTGTSYAAHGHLSLTYDEHVSLTGHAIHAFSQDDRATPTTQRDGSIDVFGADLRLSLHKLGHLYAGYGHTKAKDARSVSAVIRVLNAPGGPGLMDEYFGDDSGGNGSLDTIGAEYDLSLGRLLNSEEAFDGKRPDVVLSGFGIHTQVKSPVAEFDGVSKLKYGGEVTYSMLSWFAVSGRYDRVMPDTSDAAQTHAIVSPRIIFKSDWQSQDQVVLQYSRYMSGSRTTVKVGYPPERDPTVVPDEHVISLAASMWF